MYTSFSLVLSLSSSRSFCTWIFKRNLDDLVNATLQSWHAGCRLFAIVFRLPLGKSSPATAVQNSSQRKKVSLAKCEENLNISQPFNLFNCQFCLKTWIRIVLKSIRGSSWVQCSKSPKALRLCSGIASQARARHTRNSPPGSTCLRMHVPLTLTFDNFNNFALIACDAILIFTRFFTDFVVPRRSTAPGIGKIGISKQRNVSRHQ